MIKTILVPLDGSPLAEQGLQAACSVAREAGATLVLVRAVPFYALTHDDEINEAAALQKAQKYLRGVQRQVAASGIAADIDLLPADPVGAIQFALHEQHADLICMSTHGTGGVRQAIAGSVAKAVVRLSRVPILLVRTGGDQPLHVVGPFRRILVPLDGTPLAEAAPAFLAGEQLGRTADRILLRVVEPVVGATEVVISGGMRSELEAEAARATGQHHAEAADYLTAAGQRYPCETPWRTQVTLGYPPDEIVRVAAAERVDLIVMATHGRHGLDRLVHGSVASTVLHHAPAPLLLIQSPGTASPR